MHGAILRTQLKDGLQGQGVVPWFDTERMRGNIFHQMSKGINDSLTVIVCVTEEYITKVAGKGRNGSNDNCKKEFEYACEHKGLDNITFMEMEDTKKPWTGSVGLNVGKHLYHSFKKDEELESCVDAIMKEIQRRVV